MEKRLAADRLAQQIFLQKNQKNNGQRPSRGRSGGGGSNGDVDTGSGSGGGDGTDRGGGGRSDQLKNKRSIKNRLTKSKEKAKKNQATQ